MPYSIAKKSLSILLLLFMPLALEAAAPDDISDSQRAWFDAVDINGDNNYTNNPSNNSPIPQWSDKSGNGNNVSSNGNQRPLYRLNTIAPERHGVDFDGINDSLVDSSDIWTGTAISQTENFVVATTDNVQQGSIFNSTNSNSNRLGSHLPWSDSITYFDQGNCCSSASRLSGFIPISLSQQYFWHFIGLSTQHSVLQDGELRLNDSTGTATYNILPGAMFTLGAFSSTHAWHNGRVFEAIFYQRGLNNAERRIISSYLSAKWNKAFSASPAYADAYAGDDSVNGNYDYFVGGIGQDNGVQTIGTSQGLKITNTSFLNGNGKFILAGVNYLTTSPITGITSTDLPSAYESRSKRTWYIDTTGSGGLANLSFNASTIGIPIDNGASYGLLHRSGVSGTFSEVATATMSGGLLNFSHLPADGIYSIGIIGDVNISFKKTSTVFSDPVNATVNPKAIPGALVDYSLSGKNSGSASADANTIKISDTLSANTVLFTGNLDGSGNPFAFTDNFCPPASNTSNSNLNINFPNAVVYKNSAGSVITPANNYDAAIRSFEVDISGAFAASDGTNDPCFTVRYRTRIE